MKAKSKRGFCLIEMMIMLALMNSPVFAGWELNFEYPYGTCSAVFFTDEEYGWCGGQDGAIFHTSDGGQTWNQQLAPLTCESIYSIFFVNQQKGWAVGELYPKGAIYYTTDGGDYWQLQDTLPSCGFLDIDFVDSLCGWTVGWYDLYGNDSLAAIYYTSTGGNTWIKQDPGFNGTLGSVDFIDSLLGWATGLIYKDWIDERKHGVLLLTTNGGATWQIKACPADTLYSDIEFLDSQNGWLCGYYCSYPDTPYYYQGFTWKTQDAGSTWNVSWQGPYEPLPTRSALYSLDFIDSQTGWVGGSFDPDYNVILHTTDGGSTWLEQSVENSIYDLTIYSICALSTENAWAAHVSAGSGWPLIHYTSGQSVEERTENTPYLEKACLSVYPNPFTYQVAINCYSHSGKSLTLQIYNGAGSLIKTLKANKQNRLFWDGKDEQGKNLPSGVYFCRLISNDFTLTKKIVLLR